MQNKTRTQEISALGHLVIQNSSRLVNDKSFYRFSSTSGHNLKMVLPIFWLLSLYACNVGVYR